MRSGGFFKDLTRATVYSNKTMNSYLIMSEAIGRLKLESGLSLPHYLNNDALLALTVELGVIYLLPRTEV